MIVAVIGYALTTVTAWSLEAHDANGKTAPAVKIDTGTAGGLAVADRIYIFCL